MCQTQFTVLGVMRFLGRLTMALALPSDGRCADGQQEAKTRGDGREKDRSGVTNKPRHSLRGQA